MQVRRNDYKRQRHGNIFVAGSMKNFGGMILTGWSRYDHFAVLAELLPVAVPSLLMSLTILRRGIPPATSETVQQQYQSLTSLVNCTMNPMWNGATGNIGAQVRVPTFRNVLSFFLTCRDATFRALMPISTFND